MAKRVSDNLWDMAEKLGSVLYDRGSSRYYVQIFCAWPGEKKRKRHRIYADTEGEAKKVLRRIQGEIAHGSQLHNVLIKYVKDQSRNAFIKKWHEFCDEKAEAVEAEVLDPRRVKELRRYEDRDYLSKFAKTPLHAISENTLVAWIRWMRKKKTKPKDEGEKPKRRVGEKTIKNVLYDIGHFLKWLERQGDIIEAPDLPSDEIREVEYLPEVPEADVVALVMSHIPEDMRGIFLIRSRMGFRPMEARRLNVADLRYGSRDDLLDAHIALPPRSAKKKKKARKLQLHPEVASWLIEHADLDRFGADPLFTNPNAYNDEGRWKESSERRVLVKAYRDAGVMHIKPNEMGRHFFGTHAVNDPGADIYPVQAWLGHTDPKTTERYAQMRPIPIARILDPKGESASEVPQTKKQPRK
jgi:integrase